MPSPSISFGSKIGHNNMLRLIHFKEDNNPEPSDHILSRMTDDKTRRPICFVFADQTEREDDFELFLDKTALIDSVNYKQMKDGYAYPLYNTLFADLREVFNDAIRSAKFTGDEGVGYWPTDATMKGVTVNKRNDLANIPPIWPKL
jgi:hypothetical protein